MGSRTLVAVNKNGMISETTLGADSFLVLEDGQLEKVFKNDVDKMKPAQLAKVCAKLGAETLISGDVPPKLADVKMVRMDAGTSPAWYEDEYSQNKIDALWQDRIEPLLENGESVVIQPMPQGDEAFHQCWLQQAECIMKVVLQDDTIVAYDLLRFDKEDFSGDKYIDRLAKLEKILKKVTHISLIEGKVLWPQASFDEFKETIDWGLAQKDIAYVAVRDLDFQYEEPEYLKKSQSAWRVVAPPTRTLMDVLSHPFKVLRELKEE